MKKATPGLSPRASALAAPKKLEPTISPRATSSDHSTGALSRNRSDTDTQTTSRSAASRTAATASLIASNATMIQWRPAGVGTAPEVTSILRLGRADRVHDRLGLGMRLDEIVGLRRNALAERFAVDLDHGDALLGDRGGR